MTEAIAFDAPAKINLALHVTGRRDDGYHRIDSLVVFTRFADRVEVAQADEDSFAVDGPFAKDVPEDATNLVLRARDALQAVGAELQPLHHASAGEPAVHGHPPPLRRGGKPVAIRLTKNLPVASGIGGGSSDAAAALRGLADLWQLDVSEGELAKIGLSLGADVPMCFAARPLLARGVGDELTLLPGFPALGLVLVNPGVAVATADVFRALASRDNAPLPPLPRAIEFHSLRNWLGTTRNDLQAAAEAIAPPIGAAIRALERAGSGFTRMSGSGATCFGLFETGNVAKRAAATLRQRHPDWFVAATRSIASEDMHGPQ